MVTAPQRHCPGYVFSATLIDSSSAQATTNRSEATTIRPMRLTGRRLDRGEVPQRDAALNPARERLRDAGERSHGTRERRHAELDGTACEARNDEGGFALLRVSRESGVGKREQVRLVLRVDDTARRHRPE